MAESFVDVSYRGLDLGRRLKLRDVRPDVAYLEVPLPMPVGTSIEIDTGEGVTITAVVTAVHEQVAGSEAAPGMKVKPTLDSKAGPWWKVRVDAAAMAAEAAEADAKAASASRIIAEAAALAKAQAEAAEAAADAKAAAASKVIAEAAVVAKAEAEAAEAAEAAESGKKKNGKRNGKGRARSEPGAEAASSDGDVPPAQLPESSGPMPVAASGGRATIVMSTEAVQAALAAAMADDDGLVDDGKRTEAMAAVDPAALGLEAPAAAAAADDNNIKRTTVMDAIDVSMITGEPTTDVGVGGSDDDDAEITIEAEDGDEGEESATSKSGKTVVADGKAKPRGAKRRRKR